MATLATRVISGKGLVRLDLDAPAWKRGKVLTTYATVVREPFNQYLNFNYNPPRSRYAQLVFLRNGYVQFVRNLEFKYQMWDDTPDMSAQSMYAIQCAYAGILQTFFNLGNALALPSISVTNHIEDWLHINLLFDEIKVVCYADTAVRIVVESISYDLCPEQEDKEGFPPPPPPPNPPPVPPGTPLQDSDVPLSDPYDGENDDGDTVPHPIDVVEEPPEFPQGERCARYYITYSFQPVGGGARVEGSQPHFGEIEYVGINPDDNTLGLIVSHGLILTPGSPCLSGLGSYNAGSSSAGIEPGSFEYTIVPL